MRGYPPPVGAVRKCKNNCGWTAFGNFDTCCTRCLGPAGPHAADCAQKNTFAASLPGAALAPMERMHGPPAGSPDHAAPLGRRPSLSPAPVLSPRYVHGTENSPPASPRRGSLAQPAGPPTETIPVRQRKGSIASPDAAAGLAHFGAALDASPGGGLDGGAMASPRARRMSFAGLTPVERGALGHHHYHHAGLASPLSPRSPATIDEAGRAPDAFGHPPSPTGAAGAGHPPSPGSGGAAVHPPSPSGAAHPPSPSGASPSTGAAPASPRAAGPPHRAASPSSPSSPRRRASVAGHGDVTPSDGGGKAGHGVCSIGHQYCILKAVKVYEGAEMTSAVTNPRLQEGSIVMVCDLSSVKFPGGGNLQRAQVCLRKGMEFEADPCGWITCQSPHGEALVAEHHDHHESQSHEPKAKKSMFATAMGVGAAAFNSSVTMVGKVAGEQNAERMRTLGVQSGEWIGDKLTPHKQKVVKMMEDSLKSKDDGKLSYMLDTALESGMLNSAYTPSVVAEAAQRVASNELTRALESKDPKKLKGALVMAGRLGATHSKEYKDTLQQYRLVRKLPDHWEALGAKRGRLLGRAEMSDKSLVDLFQFIIEKTFRRVLTRDRKGELPEKLQVLSVTEVLNEEGWCNYALRREEIQAELNRTAKTLGPVRPLQVDTLAALDAGVSGTWGAEKVDLPGLSLDRGVNEVLLFHGTHPIAAEAIADTAFQVNLAGSNAGTLYGRGIYLAENASKSDEYSSASKKGVCTMLLCRAVLGRAFYTDAVSPDPRVCEKACLEQAYHCVLGDRLKARGTFREFVVFDQDQVYPNFLVTYKRLF
mmetsp:Transcript_38833/g.91353  ORF Transcript_38833/g.91353 Transcript_38833/m.91353 type:complete len:818 (+) Transcript_38833:67-2520(+)